VDRITTAALVLLLVAVTLVVVVFLLLLVFPDVQRDWGDGWSPWQVR
jgi:hypothetical protein